METRARILGVALIALSTSFLGGCGIRESHLVGHWSLKVDPGTGQDAEIAKGFANTVSFDLRSDHTFSGTLFIVPLEGTWSLNGKQVIGQITKAFGQAPSGKQADDKVVLDVSDDGKAMTVEPGPHSSGKPVVFVKAEGQ